MISTNFGPVHLSEAERDVLKRTVQGAYNAYVSYVVGSNDYCELSIDSMRIDDLSCATKFVRGFALCASLHRLGS